jgi:outer membrane protein OmpA-like peptidoglycan-associated protein
MDNTNPGQPKTDQTGTTGSNKNQLNSNTDKQADKTNTDKQADKTNTDKQADKTNPSDKTQPNTNQTKSNNPSDKQNTNQDSNIKSNGDKTNPSNPSLQLNNETILSGKDSLAQLNSKATASNKIKDKTSTSGAVTNSMNAISNEYSEASNPEITDSSLFNNILFEFNKQTFNEAGRTELDRLVAYLNKHTLNAVKATGHADAVGGDAYNLVLSQKRAMQVAAYIVSKGINQNRIKVDYKGKARPVAPNENPDKSDNPDGRRLNRRVELEILNK